MNIHEQLERDEGFVPHAYQDSRGYWTIGIGTCIDGRLGLGITKEEAYELLDRRLAAFTKNLVASKPWVQELDEARFGVLQNMLYNLGVAGLLGFHTFFAHLERKEWEYAAAAMLDSKWATQVGERAKRLAEQMRTGVWQ